MNLPDEPFYCEICKKESMAIAKAKQSDGHYEFTGMFTLPTYKVNGEEYRFHPITAMCSDCGQVKIFLKADKVITD